MWLARLLACLHTLWHCLAVVGPSCPALLPWGGWVVGRSGVYNPSQLLGKIVLHPLWIGILRNFLDDKRLFGPFQTLSCPVLFWVGWWAVVGCLLGFMTQVSCLFWRHRICQISYIRKIKTRWNQDGNSLNLLHWNLNLSVVAIQLSCDNSIWLIVRCSGKSSLFCQQKSDALYDALKCFPDSPNYS